MTHQPKYQCWGPDKEDLTDQVARVAASQGDTVVTIFRWDIGKALNTMLNRLRRAAPRENRIVVVCSKGHENVFVVKPS